MTSNSSTHWCSPRLLKVLYSSMIILLWVCGMYLCCSVGQEEYIKSIMMSIIIPIMSITLITFPFIIYMGGCIVSLPDACKDVSTCGGAEMEEK